MKEKSKQIGKQLCLFLLLFTIVLIIFIIRPLGNLDELWNYNFANQMAYGLVPYRDFNMLQTPLLPFIGSIFLRLFGNEVMVTRVLGAFISSFILFMILKIGNILKINKWLSYLAVALLIYIMKDLFAYDYNYAVLLVAFIILYLELKKFKSKDKLIFYEPKHEILIGLLAGIACCFKQSTGLIIAIILVGYKILEIRKKEDILLFLKILFTRLIGGFLPLLLLLTYLIYHQAFEAFIDYTIYGIQTFSNQIPYTMLFHQEPILIPIFSMVIPITLVFLFAYYWIKKDKIAFLIAVIGTSEFSVTFPICDKIHFMIGSMIGFIGLVYLVSKLGKRLLTKEKVLIFLENFSKILVIGLVIIFFFTISFSIKEYVQEIKEDTSNLKHYKAIVINTQLKQRILAIDEFISNQNKDVIILDAEAAVYRIPLDQYLKDYDMFLKGNLGGKDEQGQIEKLSKQTSSYILITNEKYFVNWQTPTQVIDYVRQNREKIGEIEKFDIYE